MKLCLLGSTPSQCDDNCPVSGRPEIGGFARSLESRSLLLLPEGAASYRHMKFPECRLTGSVLQEAPKLKLLLLNTKAGNLWDDGAWTPAMVERMQSKGIRVIQSAGYKTSVLALVACLQDALRDDPQLLKYAKYVL